MSWAWMTGVVAAQVPGGAFTLKLLGIPPLMGMIMVAGVLVPFLAYLVERSGPKAFSPRAIRLSLLLGGASTAVVLILTQITRIGRVAGSSELTILLVGLGFPVAGPLVGSLEHGCARA